MDSIENDEDLIEIDEDWIKIGEDWIEIDELFRPVVRRVVVNREGQRDAHAQNDSTILLSQNKRSARYVK